MQIENKEEHIQCRVKGCGKCNSLNLPPLEKKENKIGEADLRKPMTSDKMAFNNQCCGFGAGKARENKWQDRFDERFPCGIVEEVDFRGTKNLFAFIQSEIDTAIAEDRERVENELNKFIDIYVPDMRMPSSDTHTETILPKKLFVKAFINLITKEQ